MGVQQYGQSRRPKKSVEEEARKRFGRNVRARRSQLALSQEKAAAMCDMDRAYYGGIERGERNPSLDNIVRIARTLDIRIAQLVAGIDD